ncbi:autotransporter outer membrane beta-barrel domain-containing protein [Methylosinus sp. Sm6]|uniref:autotransporter outer membrane beta-barrel domain-containing protein n=1 Tax=Methylosinus sp. Sm6 TaxID=2866948 RepID=UPI001C995AC5|nr:autotransporter outer membrane beta-barrel domain-containing protein [Methylosinus sp. Sm6]MBY6241270.1 autotransporter outer membrane beta-barrel domain-containing protein [Methylosinus sp. Sm6]
MTKRMTLIHILVASAALASSLAVVTARAQEFGGGGDFVGGGAGDGSVGALGGGNNPELEAFAARTHNVLCPSTAPLINGQCYDASGFSGAALASQALSSLSQSTTQSGNNSALGKLRERREQEAASCAAGFSRVGGECRPNEPQRREAQQRPVEQAKTKTAQAKPARAEKGKRVAARDEGRLGPRLASRPAGLEGGRRYAPTPAGTSIEPIGAGGAAASRWMLYGTPIPLSPDARFGSWIEGYGDFERRTGGGDAYVLPGLNVGMTQIPIRVSAKSETTSYGFQMGFDLTSRGVLEPNDGLIAGVLLGAAHSDLALSTATVSSNLALVDNGSSRLRARFNGGSAGVYATYFDGPFSADFLAKADIFHLNASFTDNIAFAPNYIDGEGNIYYGAAARIVPYSASQSTNVKNVSLAANLNYRLPLTTNLWLEPTVGAQYTTTLYDNSAKLLGLADGEQVRVQGGGRVGTNFLVGSMPTTFTVTGLAYDDVLIAGGFVSVLAFNGGNFLAQSNEGKPRGRGIIALNFDHGDGIASYVQGEVRGGSGLIGGGGKAGVRFSW